MRQAKMIVLICAISAVVSPGTAFIAAQPRISPASRVTIPAESECPRCSITVTRRLAVGDLRGPGLLEHTTKVAVDSRGRIYVPSRSAGAVRVFDSTGRFVALIGRPGDGPGEFRDPGPVIVGSRDTLLILDRSRTRISSFSPSYSHIASNPAPFMLGQLIRMERRSVAVVLDRSASVLGYPLVLLDREASVVRPFGTASPVADPRRPYDLYRTIANAGQGRIWSAWSNRYVVEQWDTAGKWLQQLERRTDWFPSWTVEPADAPFGSPPMPVLSAVAQDSTGLLWTFTTVADSRWRRRPTPSTTATVTNYDDIYDTVIEVLNPRTGRLVASTRVGERLTLVGDGIAQSDDERIEGSPRIAIWNLTLSVRKENE